MVSLNKVSIIGNLGSDTEMRYAPSGKPVTTFRVAVNTRYKDNQGESKEETEWFSIVAWGKTAELCNQYLHKGSLVYVEGRNRTRSWGGQDGQKHYKTELIANKVLFLTKNTESKTEIKETNGEDEISPDELPF